METCQANAVGVIIEVTILEDGSAVDVSTVTTKEIVFRKPDGTSVTKAASFVNSGSDGKIKYVTVSGFLDVVGTWEAQGYVTFPGSGAFDGPSGRTTFEVAENLPHPAAS